MKLVLVLIAGILLHQTFVNGEEEYFEEGEMLQGGGETILSHTSMCSETNLPLKDGQWGMMHFKLEVDASSERGTPGEVLENTRLLGMPAMGHFTKKTVFPGWYVPLVNRVCKGDKIVFTIPPEMGFNDNVTLRFELEMLEIDDKEIELPSLFDRIDLNNDGQIDKDEFGAFQKLTNQNRKGGDEENNPIYLFDFDDENENEKLSWKEFSGPKGTTPPAAAAKIIELEEQDEELLDKARRNAKLKEEMEKKLKDKKQPATDAEEEEKSEL